MSSESNEVSTIISDKQLVELNRQAGRSLPMLKKDPALAKMTPILDFNELKRAGAERLVARRKKA